MWSPAVLSAKTSGHSAGNKQWLITASVSGFGNSAKLRITILEPSLLTLLNKTQLYFLKVPQASQLDDAQSMQLALDKFLTEQVTLAVLEIHITSQIHWDNIKSNFNSNTFFKKDCTSFHFFWGISREATFPRPSPAAACCCYFSHTWQTCE